MPLFSEGPLLKKAIYSILHAIRGACMALCIYTALAMNVIFENAWLHRPL